MVLEFSESFNHSCGNKAQKEYSEEELKQLLLDLMGKSGINTEKVNTEQEGLISISDAPKMNLHTVILEAEKLGLKTKYVKKTQIELCC